MASFFFQLELPPFTMEMMAVIPEHREQVNTMFSEGKMLSYSVSMNRNMIWFVVNAEDEQHAMESVLSLPLYPWFTDEMCTPLLFHNTLPASMPGIFLN